MNSNDLTWPGSLRGNLPINRLTSRLPDESGQTTAEYSVVLTVIALAVLGLAAVAGHEILALFNAVTAIF